jgi:hypothetical protein
MGLVQLLLGLSSLRLRSRLVAITITHNSGVKTGTKMRSESFVLPRLLVLLTCLGGLFGAAPASAEMLDFSTPQGVISWPKLPDMPDWHQDQDSSLRLAANSVIPDGVDPANTDVKIEARGFPRRGNSGSTSLDQLLESDRAAAPAGTQVKQLADVADKDGTPFHLYVFASPGSNRVVAYSEEGEYLLAFTFFARSQAGYDSNFPVFVSLIRKYAKEIPW